MKMTMEKADVKNFNKPDEVRTFPKGRVELINIGDVQVGRAIFEPGWKWSTCVKPISNTESCQAPHFQYQVSGTMHVLMDDGEEFNCMAGDVSMFPTGHDAWVIGDKPVILVDFQGMRDYAKR